MLHDFLVQGQWMSLLGLSRTVSLLTGAGVKDFSAGHLAVSPELAGPLLPHRHGHPLPPLSPGHERVRGVECWAAFPDAALGCVQGARVRRAAAVNCSFSVQVRPPSPASPVETKTNRSGKLCTEKNVQYNSNRKECYKVIVFGGTCCVLGKMPFQFKFKH